MLKISTRALSAGNQRRNENTTHSDRAGEKRAELEWWLFNVTPQRSYRYTYSYLVGDFVVFTADASCSMGVRADDEQGSVRGIHGEPHRNPAGDFLHVWAGQGSICAAAALCPGRKPRDGCGAWRHFLPNDSWGTSAIAKCDSSLAFVEWLWCRREWS